MAVKVFFTDGRIEEFPNAGMALRTGRQFRVFEAAPPNREIVRTFDADDVVQAEVSGRLNYTARGLGQLPSANQTAITQATGDRAGYSPADMPQTA